MAIHAESHNSHIYFIYRGPYYPRELVLEERSFEVNLLKTG